MSAAFDKEGRSDQKRKPRDERWPELLAVAAEVFYAKGYAASSLQEIADRLGIMKGSLYYYIRSKEDILVTLLTDIHERGVRNVSELASGEGTALERLTRVIHGHIGFISANLIETALFLRELKALPPERQAAILGDELSYSRIFRQLLAEGQKDGSILKTLDPDLTATIVLGSLNATNRWLKPADKEGCLRVADHYARILIGGLKA